MGYGVEFALDRDAVLMFRGTIHDSESLVDLGGEAARGN